MYKNIIYGSSLALCLFLLFSCQSKQEPTKSSQQVSITEQKPKGNKSAVKEISVERLVRELKKDSRQFEILDVRSPEEIESGAIKNHININFYDDDFKEKVNELDKNKPYIVYCKSGVRSSKTVEFMTENGFAKVLNLAGGYDAFHEMEKN